MKTSKSTQNTHGGRRENSGRPKTNPLEHRRNITISLRSNEHEKLKSIAEQKDVTISELIRMTFQL